MQSVLQKSLCRVLASVQHAAQGCGGFNRSAHSAVPNLDDLMTGCLDALRIGLRIRRIGRIGRIGRSGRLDRLVGLRGLGGLIGLDGFGGSGGLGGLDENRWKSLIIDEKSNRSIENR